MSIVADRPLATEPDVKAGVYLATDRELYRVTDTWSSDDRTCARLEDANTGELSTKTMAELAEMTVVTPSG